MYSNILRNKPEIKQLANGYTVLCHGFAALHQRTRAPGAHVPQLTTDAFLMKVHPHVITPKFRLANPSSVDPATLIANSALVAQESADGKLDETSSFVPVDAVRYCFLHLSLYREQIPAGRAKERSLITRNTETQTPNAQGSIDWSGLWKAISSAVHRYFRDTKWEATYDEQYWHLPLPILTPDELLAEGRELAGKCLEIMDTVEGEKDADRLERPAGEPALPDELVAALGLFILPSDVSKYPKLTRLQAQERSRHPKVEGIAQGNSNCESKTEEENEGGASKEYGAESEDGSDQHESRIEEGPPQAGVGTESKDTWAADGSQQEGVTGGVVSRGVRAEMVLRGGNDGEQGTDDKKSADFGESGDGDSDSGRMTR